MDHYRMTKMSLGTYMKIIITSLVAISILYGLIVFVMSIFMDTVYISLMGKEYYGMVAGLFRFVISPFAALAAGLLVSGLTYYPFNALIALRGGLKVQMDLEVMSEIERPTRKPKAAKVPKEKKTRELRKSKNQPVDDEDDYDEDEDEE